MDKTLQTLSLAVADIADDSVLMIGGFGGSGAPIELIHAVIDRFRETGSPKNLTIVNNNAGNGKIGIAAMLKVGMVKKVICSFPRTADSQAFTERYLAGDVELELVPQGTLAERIRAAGAGIPAFFTPTSYGTELAAGKQVQEFDGKCYVLERWRNFNPLMCTAATKTIAQVSAIVEPGEIDPEQVITPGLFVDGIVEVPEPQQEEAMIRAGEVYA
jgi:3-oxoadipate CoA-transferase alpha subunit